jgi:hypothetical protein
MVAGDLTEYEYETCAALSWRLVMAAIRGPVAGADAYSVWELAFEQINNRDKIDAVMEILATAVAEWLVVVHGGRENAARQVESLIAAALDRAADSRD